ncbi:Triacylglycerol lipase 2 [Halotydeus destructor]|nr:Triacylglycerol lipase 2 [Halotydeus destructor]
MTAHIPSHMENIADIDHHDANASLHEIIKSRGFFCEESEVTTQDGYLVTVNRLHNGSQDGGRSKYPVMLVHGNKTSGVMWLVMDTRGQCRQSGQDECDISLAYTLANQGFDVWIVSMRGSRPSRRHVSLDPESAKYWDFSMDDLTSDMAQLVDHVKTATQSSTLGSLASH